MIYFIIEEGKPYNVFFFFFSLSSNYQFLELKFIIIISSQKGEEERVREEENYSYIQAMKTKQNKFEIFNLERKYIG